jgi:5-methylcytosine-specific restriction endonuclease McrA
MSTKRRAHATFVGKGPNGRNLCFCGCGREVEKPRINWFSDACVSAWKRINDPATIRRLVHERDHGICAVCGVDSDREQRIALETERLWHWLARREAERLLDLKQLPSSSGDGKAYAFGECWHWANVWVAEQIKARGWSTSGHTWEADHIVPVVEGGGQCGLENYRTLCLRCHRKATAELARRRASARRGQNQAKSKQIPLLELSLP